MKKWMSLIALLALVLPMILSGFIPGQEAGNIPWVVDQGAGNLLGGAKPALE